MSLLKSVSSGYEHGEAKQTRGASYWGPLSVHRTTLQHYTSADCHLVLDCRARHRGFNP